jgi:hypothetical protein
MNDVDVMLAQGETAFAINIARTPEFAAMVKRVGEYDAKWLYVLGFSSGITQGMRNANAIVDDVTAKRKT